MSTSTETIETQALIANDIRVLASQLNDAAKKAAERGLRVNVEVSNVLDVKSVATSYPVLSVQVQAEVR